MIWDCQPDLAALPAARVRDPGDQADEDQRAQTEPQPQEGGSRFGASRREHGGRGNRGRRVRDRLCGRWRDGHGGRGSRLRGAGPRRHCRCGGARRGWTAGGDARDGALDGAAAALPTSGREESRDDDRRDKRDLPQRPGRCPAGRDAAGPRFHATRCDSEPTGAPWVHVTSVVASHNGPFTVRRRFPWRPNQQRRGAACITPAG